MKKQFLLLIISVFTLSLNAQVFTEYFEDAPTNALLEEYNDWYLCLKSSQQNGVSPVVVEEFLFYTDYAGSDIGKAVFLDSLVGKDDDGRISTKVVTFGEGDTLRPVIGEKMYAAFLVQILPNSYNSFRDFFTWEGSTTSNFSRGRVFAKLSNDTDLQFAVSKNSSSSGVYVESEVYEGAVNSIFLMVLEYDAIEGDGNDVISLYINPDPTLPAAEQATILMSQDEQSDYSETLEIKINLRQRGVGANIGNIRVGRTWEEVLQVAEEEEEEEEEETTAIKVVNMNEVLISAFNKTIVTEQSGVVAVYEFSGRKVLESKTSGSLQTSLKSGLYIVHFTDADNNVSSSKISIN